MYLGIDIGTSAVKGVLVCENGTHLAGAMAPLATATPHPSWCEQNPEIWWNATTAICGQLRRLNPGAYGNIRAIGLSGQMHGAVCLDDKYRVIRPAILWNDGRSYEESLALSKEQFDVAQLAGVRPMPGFTAPKIMWMKNNEPEHYARIAHILLPKDYIRHKLTDTLATDMSDAAGTLWLDQAQRTWSSRLCRASATEPEWLPVCLEGNDPSGTLTRACADEVGLRHGIAVVAGGGDAAAGAIGVGAIHEGDAFISLGTSGQLFVATESYRPCPQSTLHAFAHCLPERWFQMAAMLNGASPLQWYGRVMGEGIDALLAEAEVESVEISKHIPLFLPYLAGERTPHNDPNIRGNFHGIEHATTRADLTRAVLEGIAYSFCEAALVFQTAGTKIDRPMVIGGGARGDLLVQTLADALNLTIVRHGDVESSPAFGAARLAALADQSISLADLTSRRKVDRIFTPSPDQYDRHQRQFDQFRGLYQALKPLSETAI